MDQHIYFIKGIIQQSDNSTNGLVYYTKDDDLQRCYMRLVADMFILSDVCGEFSNIIVGKLDNTFDFSCINAEQTFTLIYNTSLCSYAFSNLCTKKPISDSTKFIFSELVPEDYVEKVFEYNTLSDYESYKYHNDSYY
jgi:hypothetical protein